jgi:peptide/nickel transport system substrate-binding protein
MIRRRVWPAFALILALAGAAPPQGGGELRFCLRAEPKTFHPLQAPDESSETIRYLTAGVLIRLHRVTQKLEPELAVSWKVLEGGRAIAFQLRDHVRFSDGTPFSAADVAHTVRLLMDPNLHSPIGDSFRSGKGTVEAVASDPRRVTIRFPAPLAAIERQFDQLAMLSARSPLKEKAVLGAFRLAEHKPGQYVLLERNPHYWKRDAAGGPLPYLDAIRLDIQQNREIELLRFRRGQLHLINTLDAEFYDRLAAESPGVVFDAGPSLDLEQMWFNQAPGAPLPEHKKAWFASRDFRRAVSEAIHREDLCRVVFKGHAAPGIGPVSPANRLYASASLVPHRYDPKAAIARLAGAGFSLREGQLFDRGGSPVEFSLITNAGNKSRERMGVMIQQDLAKIGIRLNLVTLDFPSLIERIASSFNYEACLLGLVNVDLDPNAQMNVWLSSGANHAWNPNQKSAATAWEAEIDRLMQLQASATDERKRKAYFDRVQQIVWEEAPVLYLVYRNALSAVSPAVRHAAVSVLSPRTFWNIEHLALDGAGVRGR